MEELARSPRLMVRQMLFLDPPAHTRMRQAWRRRRSRRGGSSTCVGTSRDRRPAARRRRGRRGSMDVIADLAAPASGDRRGGDAGRSDRGLPAAHRPGTGDFAEILGNFQHNPDQRPPRARRVEEHDRVLPATLSASSRGTPRAGCSARCCTPRSTATGSARTR